MKLIAIILLSLGQLTLQYHESPRSLHTVDIHHWDRGRVADLTTCMRGPGTRPISTVRIEYLGRLRSLNADGRDVKMVAESDAVAPYLFVWVLTCAKYDYDNDGDVDLRDYAVFHNKSRE